MQTSFDRQRRARKAKSPGITWAFREREKGFEPSTSTLARWHSTTELLPQRGLIYGKSGRLSTARWRALFGSVDARPGDGACPPGPRIPGRPWPAGPRTRPRWCGRRAGKSSRRRPSRGGAGLPVPPAAACAAAGAACPSAAPPPAPPAPPPAPRAPPAPPAPPARRRRRRYPGAAGAGRAALQVAGMVLGAIFWMMPGRVRRRTWRRRGPCGS